MPARSRRRALFLALAAGTLAAPATHAQPIATDRPDFTESTSVVGLGRLQVEAGTSLTVDAASGSTQTVLSGPETLLRIGLGSGFEARIVLPDVEAPFQSTGGLGTPTLGDASAGFKAELGPAAGLDVAVIVEASILGEGGLSPHAVVMLGRDVGAGVSVGGQVEAGYDPDARRVLPAATLVGGLTLGGPVATFAEVAVSSVPDGPAAVVLHHGYTLAVGEALQLDVHGGAGLTATAPDVFVGAGVGVRF
ncbi:MAG TPA: hypothetical protein VGB53_02260 [Rubricoccaceae bacterium]|jgi:hypothetical protein